MTTTGTHTTGTHTTGSRASINNSQPTCIGTLPVGVGESHPSAIMSTAEASVVCYSNNIGGNSISTGKDTGGTLVSSVGCDDVETSTVVCSTNSSSALNLKCAFEAVLLLERATAVLVVQQAAQRQLQISVQVSIQTLLLFVETVVVAVLVLQLRVQQQQLLMYTV
eukprot:Lankesteria_metandrocarpae@DN938_c0_g1_i2.p1